MEDGETHPWSWIKRNWIGKVMIFSSSSSSHLFFLQHLDQKPFLL
jgi:hypothetical protein